MGFIQTQILIFATIIIASLLAGKKGAVMSIAVWLVETIIVIKVNNLSYVQMITVSLAFQLGIIIGVARDFIMKKIKGKSNG